MNQMLSGRGRSVAVVAGLLLFIGGSALAPHALADLQVGAQLTLLCALALKAQAGYTGERSSGLADGLSAPGPTEVPQRSAG